jgi:hypothetical protein
LKSEGLRYVFYFYERFWKLDFAKVYASVDYYLEIEEKLSSTYIQILQSSEIFLIKSYKDFP